MNNLSTALKILQPAAMQKLAARLLDAPHIVTPVAAGIAIPLKMIVELVAFVPDLNLPQEIQHAVFKRKLSFIGGRLCAEAALARSGLADVTVERESNGAPVWPPGYAGSITHTANCAYALVSQTDFKLGIDSENIFTDAESRDVRHLCLTSDENTSLYNERNSNLIATLIFSVKESFYKAIHSHVQRYVDFSEIEVAAIDWHHSTIQLKAVAQGDLNPLVARCQASFCISNSAVHTSVEISPNRPP